jgi:hypothetical protein
VPLVVSMRGVGTRTADDGPVKSPLRAHLRRCSGKEHRLKSVLLNSGDAMYYRARLLLLLLVGITARAQQIPDTETYAVRGTVLNSISAEPIPWALVRLDSVGESAAREVRADAEGKFAFASVSAKAAYLSASKPGYFPVLRGTEHPMQLRVAVHRNSSAAIVRLVPEGIIYGRITGADGEPIEGMRVQLLEKKVADGRGRWLSGEPSTVTDDDGRFRLAELDAGTYFLLAGPEHFDEIANGADSSKVSQYGAMFYPGVSDFAEATAIELPVGRHAEVDVKLVRQALYRVSGIVEGAPAGRAAQLVILNGTGQGIGMYSSNSTGAFDVTNVPTSANRLAAISDGGEGLYFGEIKLRLAADVTNQRLKMWRVPEIDVKVRTEVTHEDKTDRQKAVRGTRAGTSQPGVEAPDITLVAEEQDTVQPEIHAERWGKQLVIRGVVPGNYGLRVTPDGPYYVASAQMGDVNLVDEDLTVVPGSALPAMEIVLRDDGANLAVFPQRDGVNLTGLVVLWPLDAQMMIGAQPSYVGSPARFDHVRPGRYRVLALENGERAEYRSADFRQHYESKWQEITLQANQSATMKVEVTKDLE